MAHHRITNLTRRARRIEPQYLIQNLLHICILGARSGRKPVPNKQLVNRSQRERQSSFDAVDGAEFWIHEDVRGRDAAYPGSGNRAVKKSHRERDGAGAVGDDVDLFLGGRALEGADMDERGLDVEASVKGGVIFLGDHGFADAVGDAEGLITGRGEVLDCVGFDRGEGEYLVVHCCARDEQDLYRGRSRGFCWRPHVHYAGNAV